MPARRLELAVETLQLVVHPVHVRAERAELVPVRRRRRGREKSPEAIAASRESICWIGPITDHERTKPSSNARTIAPAATPMKRLRELV